MKTRMLVILKKSVVKNVTKLIVNNIIEVDVEIYRLNLISRIIDQRHLPRENESPFRRASFYRTTLLFPATAL